MIRWLASYLSVGHAEGVGIDERRKSELCGGKERRREGGESVRLVDGDWRSQIVAATTKSKGTGHVTKLGITYANVSCLAKPFKHISSTSFGVTTDYLTLVRPIRLRELCSPL
jgi:hypothetical protein